MKDSPKEKWRSYISELKDKNYDPSIDQYIKNIFVWVYAKDDFTPRKLSIFKSTYDAGEINFCVEKDSSFDYFCEREYFDTIEELDEKFYTPAEYLSLYKAGCSIAPFKLTSSNGDKYIEFIKYNDDATFIYKCYLSSDDKLGFIVRLTLDDIRKGEKDPDQLFVTLEKFKTVRLQQPNEFACGKY